ncbi:MAG TPA: DUF924 family protein [Polyangiaceae bacterium]|nr:DUF924 family protein [Polyangiaceae bacterium]
MNDVLAFWFSHHDDWWAKSAAFDEAIREQFTPLRRAILAGEHEDWRKTPTGTLAYVVVLDQLSRNMFRGDARAYEGDARALAASREAIARGDDAGMSRDERTFLYLPLMHSEDLADQERGVALFQALGDPEALRSAEQHRDVVRRFGRFPHRNRILERPSTPEELAFLKEPGSSFA